MKFDLSKIDWRPGFRAGIDGAQFWEAFCKMPEGSFRGLVGSAPVFEVEELPQDDAE